MSMFRKIKVILILCLVISLVSFFACVNPLTKTNVTSSISTTNILTTSSSLTTTPTNTFTENENLEVYFLDVGQGDSEIVKCGNNTMLIDAVIRRYQRTDMIFTIQHFIFTFAVPVILDVSTILILKSWG
jgi:beta-lactamase superfamily II metal-dependent hydrolase